MTKVSLKVKIQAVEEYLTGTEVKAKVARKYGIRRMLFRILVGIYEKHGKKGLLNPPKITGKFRIKLVEWKQQHTASLTETCVQFAFRSPGSVRKWEMIYLQQGKSALLEINRGVKSHQKARSSETSEKFTKRELILAHTKRCLKKTNSLEKASNKEISQIIISLRARYKLADLIMALPISMSVFQYWQKKLASKDPDKELKQRLTEIYETHQGNYGVRRVVPEVRALYRAEGRTMPNHKKIQRLMHEMGLICGKYSKRVKKYDSSKGPNGKKAKNHFKRRFKTDRPLQKLACDVTELRAKNGDKVHLEIIKDLYSKRILEWELGTHPDLKFSLAPLKRLVRALPLTGHQVTLHTDQGWQYQHKTWRHWLRKGRIRQSMSRRATCLDNAACETCFNKLKAEMPTANQCETRKELSEAVGSWIEYYNTVRIQNSLNNRTPLGFELTYQTNCQYKTQLSKQLVKE